MGVKRTLLEWAGEVGRLKAVLARVGGSIGETGRSASCSHNYLLILVEEEIKRRTKV